MANKKYRESAIRQVKLLMEIPKDFVILDTETTGKEKDDVIIEISIIDGTGKVLLNSKVRPLDKNKKISVEAQKIHGISMSDLRHAPYFEELKWQIEDCIRGKYVIIYNAPFDTRLMHRTAKLNNFNFYSLNTLPLDYRCMMRLYANYVGESKTNGYPGFKWQKLPGGDHTSLGDCYAVLNLMRKIKNTKY